MNSDDSNTIRKKRRFLWVVLVFPALIMLTGTLFLRFSSLDLLVGRVFFADILPKYFLF